MSDQAGTKPRSKIDRAVEVILVGFGAVDMLLGIVHHDVFWLVAGFISWWVVSLPRRQR